MICGVPLVIPVENCTIDYLIVLKRLYKTNNIGHFAAQESIGFKYYQWIIFFMLLVIWNFSFLRLYYGVEDRWGQQAYKSRQRHGMGGHRRLPDLQRARLRKRWCLSTVPQQERLRMLVSQRLQQ